MMIGYIKGKLVEKDPSRVVVEINGIGYEVLIPLSTYADIKDQENIHLYTHLHIREDAHVLYGFTKKAEKNLFCHLISVNGIGPATALLALSYMSPVELQQAIMQEQVQTVRKIKGIGEKTAQRMILELKDKLKKDPSINFQETPPNTYNTLKHEALSALLTLGINRLVAEKSIEHVLTQTETIGLEDLIKRALKTT